MKRLKVFSLPKLALIGILFLLIGLTINVKILAFLFSPDRRIESPITRIMIYSFQIILISSGTICLYKRKSANIARIVSNLSLLFGSIILTFFMLELFFRAFNLFPPLTAEPKPLYRYNSLLGWEFIPNISCRSVLRYKKSTIVNTNSAGMRDMEYSIKKPEGKKRIVVLGDSFTSNVNVDLKNVFTEVMEKLLPRNWQVLNFGVDSFGPQQEFLMLENRAIKYEPDIVIMVIFIGNDFTDMLDTHLGYKKSPLARFDKDGEIIFENISVPLSKKVDQEPKRKALISFGNFHLSFIRDRFLNKNKTDIVRLQEIKLFKKKPDARIAETYRLMSAIIEKTYHFSSENDASFLVIIAPTIYQVYDNIYWSSIKKAHNCEGEKYDIFLPNDVIRNTCGDLGIHVLDLTPVLKKHALSGESMYYFPERHWNKRGNRLVAEAIVGYLLDSGLVNEINE
ncbi:MAG: hypothetical protein HQ549_05010 [Candidatus Omnitrophica bacterium]|nr:hypothetical protein [Candidatus Omnitrophota bacterium]